MRLIDADKLIDALKLCGCYKHKNPKAYDTMMLYEILGAIEDQPTAYDVDKVVEELWKLKQEYIIRHIPSGIMIDATDIVKRGGAE